MKLRDLQPEYCKGREKLFGDHTVVTKGLVTQVLRAYSARVGFQAQNEVETTGLVTRVLQVRQHRCHEDKSAKGSPYPIGQRETL